MRYWYLVKAAVIWIIGCMPTAREITKAVLQLCIAKGIFAVLLILLAILITR